MSDKMEEGMLEHLRNAVESMPQRTVQGCEYVHLDSVLAEIFELETISANKAAEEGELPELPSPDGDWAGDDWFTAYSMEEYAREAIAADRASHHVASVPDAFANKAEVEPIGYIHSLDLGKTCSTIYSPKEFRSWPLGKKADISPYIPVYATPPASTGGASATPTGASTAFMPTVLTDERIYDIAAASELGIGDDEHEMSKRTAFARAIEREVAAQAGQVAVPEWEPIETAPKTGRTLLLGCFNEMGNWRTMRGQWFTKADIDQDWEETDGFEAGWYETAVEPDFPNCWEISPTHWMELPAAPSPAKESK